MMYLTRFGLNDNRVLLFQVGGGQSIRSFDVEHSPQMARARSSERYYKTNNNKRRSLDRQKKNIVHRQCFSWNERWPRLVFVTAGAIVCPFLPPPLLLLLLVDSPSVLMGAHPIFFFPSQNSDIDQQQQANIILRTGRRSSTYDIFCFYFS